MSFASRSLTKACGSVPRKAVIQRFSSSSATTPPPLIASLLLSRPPLITPTPTPFESAYYSHSQSVQHALSSPLPLEFYFKSGSLPLRRHLLSDHEYSSKIYGPRIAGSAPDVGGDIPPETEYEILSRDHFENSDAETKRGEKSLERYPEEEVFCLVQQEQNKKWTFPQTQVERLEALDEAVTEKVIGVEGSLGGIGMDSWLVTRKPVGVVKDGASRTFFLRGHILAGEPSLSSSSGYSAFAWLSAAEVEDRLRKQGDEKLWESIKGMFGKPESGEDVE
ncbi:hypothetical protein CI109_102492 [Kwoniella shandongensis]|uniref:Large ribosomal subunit protein mL46 N-terminal domain-containing protein n=1 Tax=Kwoniella shandongensis TaxID=1734106 RepID=A0A5M6C353_9TREE|nr:uncharacterized protein CI109_003190 [Kwoniella shandongensis]KAA5528292.1 hypothetical protein CI109_003190 [Kwoniella shandongensis]